MQIISFFFVILTQNLVLSACLGMPSLAQSAKSRKQLLFNGALTALLCAFGTGLLAAIRGMFPLLHPVWMTVFGVAVTCLTDAAAVLLISRRDALKPFIPQMHRAAFSSAVLGMMLKSAAVSFPAGFRTGLEAGAGYLLCCLMLAAVLPELYSEKMPESVRGWRGVLLYAGVISLAVTCMKK